MKRYICLLSVALLCGGCVNTSKLVNALAKDPAAVSAEIVTPWGHTRLTRLGAQTNSVVIEPGQGELNRK